MQGDIYQLEALLQRPKDERKPKADASNLQTQKAVVPLIPVCKENNLSHYLFHEGEAFKHAELNEAFDHAHYLHVIASALDDYCSDMPEDYSDECAIFTEDEDDSSEAPSSPSSLIAPRKQSPVTITKPKPGSDCKTHARRHAMSEGENEKERPVVSKVQNVSRIQRPLMSLWPTPIEHMEYEWSERFYE